MLACLLRSAFDLDAFSLLCVLYSCLRIGSTIFQVHAHPSDSPCSNCAVAPNGDNVIPYSNDAVISAPPVPAPAPSTSTASEKRPFDAVDSTSSTTEPLPQQPAKKISKRQRAADAMAATRAALLQEDDDQPTGSNGSWMSAATSSKYVDRAKQRRQTHHQPEHIKTPKPYHHKKPSQPSTVPAMSAAPVPVVPAYAAQSQTSGSQAVARTMTTARAGLGSGKLITAEELSASVSGNAKDWRAAGKDRMRERMSGL